MAFFVSHARNESLRTLCLVSSKGMIGGPKVAGPSVSVPFRIKSLKKL